MVFEAAFAEEGGGGHYLPGSIASSADATLTDPAFVVRLNVIGLTLAWRPQWSPFEDLGFAMSAALPYVDLTVTATVVDESRPIGVQRSENDSAIGDAIFMPLMLSRHLSSTFRCWEVWGG